MIDLAALEAACARHGPIARVVVAVKQGSAPREIGAAMLVHAGGSLGTIGGGTLEFEAIAAAQAQLREGALRRYRKVPLGPALGQCCGGAVGILTELIGPSELAALRDAPLFARPLSDGFDTAPPFAIRRAMAAMRAGAEPLRDLSLGAWLIEPVSPPPRQIWIWGAGHVGRAMVSVLSPLPNLSLTWADTSRARFPDILPQDLRCLMSERLQDLVPDQNSGIEHYVATFSHAFDLELCHQLLIKKDFGFLGLIGSSTKWARFRSRLASLGHSAEEVARITCPIGDVGLGRHPQAIALGVAVEILKRNPSAMEKSDDESQRAAQFRRADQSLSGGCRQ